QLRAQRGVGAVGRGVFVAAARHQRVDDVQEQRVLAGEVVVDGALGHAGGSRDAIHAGGLVSGRAELGHRGVDDGGALAVGEAGRGRGVGHGTKVYTGRFTFPNPPVNCTV